MAMQGWQSDGGKDKISFYNRGTGHSAAETTDHPSPRMHQVRAVISDFIFIPFHFSHLF